MARISGSTRARASWPFNFSHAARTLFDVQGQRSGLRSSSLEGALISSQGRSPTRHREGGRPQYRPVAVAVTSTAKHLGGVRRLWV
jgi:hypothetical protein